MTKKNNSALFFFLTSLVVVALFTTFLIAGEDPYSIGRLVLIGFSYILAIIASAYWIITSKSRKRSILFLLIVSITILGVVYVLSAGSGLPIPISSASGTFQTCTQTTITITNTTFHTSYTSYGTVCEPAPSSIFPLIAFLTVLENLLVWIPVIGCMLFMMPTNNSMPGKLSRLLLGGAISGALLFNLIGIQVPNSLNGRISVLGPVNPYVAFQLCDSTTVFVGCVYVNSLYVLVDYSFWFLVACLISLVLKQLYDFIIARPMSEKRIDRVHDEVPSVT
ncbi:MAG: hypothetical protein PXY39_11545 [archaeon]|nr:hypothetical protein [archaeon]